MIRSTPGMTDYKVDMESGITMGFNIGRIAPTKPDEKPTQIMIATSLSGLSAQKTRLSLISVRTSLEPKEVVLYQVSTDDAMDVTAQNKKVTDEALRELDDLLSRADFLPSAPLHLLRDRMENYTDWLHAMFDVGFIQQ